MTDERSSTAQDAAAAVEGNALKRAGDENAQFHPFFAAGVRFLNVFLSESGLIG